MTDNRANIIVARVFLFWGILGGLAIDGFLILLVAMVTPISLGVIKRFFIPDFKAPFAPFNVFPLIWYAGLALILFCLVGFVCTFKQREKLS